MADAPNNSNQVQIKADEKELLGQYSNLAVVHHNAEEFTLNFIYLFPERAAGEAGGEPDSESQAREAAGARAAGKYRAIRSAIREASGRSGADAGAERGIRAVGVGYERRVCWRCHSTRVMASRPALHNNLCAPSDLLFRFLRLVGGLARDDPCAFRVEKFEADCEKRVARRLAVGDASKRLERTGGRCEIQAVVDLPPANAEDSRAAGTDILRESCFRTGKSRRDR